LQNLEQYKIIEEQDRTEYSLAALPGNAALFLLHVEQMMGRYDFSGHLYNLYMPEAEPFGSVAEVILKMNQFMDAMQFPQSTLNLRDISYEASKPKRLSYDRLTPEYLPGIKQYWQPTLFSHTVERYAAVFIRVQYRQNASWQGTVLWRGRDGQKKKVSFRSVLELMNIMQSAVISTDYAMLERKGIIHDESLT